MTPRILWRAILQCACLLAMAVTPANSFDDLTPSRTLDLPSALGAVPTLYPETRAPNGLVVPLEAGVLLRISPEGETVWQTRIGDAIKTPVAVGNLDGEGDPDIVAIANLNEVVALSSAGEILWRFPLPGRTGKTLPGKTGGWRGPSCADFDGDGKYEITMSNNSGWIVCLTGEGKLRWRVHADNFYAGPAALGDVDGDGLPEAVYGTPNDRLICLEGDGSVKWINTSEGRFGRSNVALVDLDGDGYPEVAWSKSFNSGDPIQYVAKASDGSPIWESHTALHGYGAWSSGDLDGDGNTDLLFGDRANTLSAFRGDGEELWRTKTGGHGYMLPSSIADIDGDGRLEVLASVRGDNENGDSFFILEGATGKILGEYKLTSQGAIPPLVCDFDADGFLDFLLTGRSAKSIDIYSLKTKTSTTAAPWPAPRVDSARTGVVPIPNEPGPINAPLVDLPPLPIKLPESVLWGSNTIDVALPANLPEKAFIEVGVVGTDGTRTTRFRNLDSVPPSEEVSVQLTRPGAHTIQLRLWDETSNPAKPVAEARAELSMKGLDSLAAWTEESLADLEAQAAVLLDTKPRASLTIAQKASVLRSSFAALTQRSVAGLDATRREIDRFASEVDGFRASLGEVKHLARVANGSPRESVAIWEDPNPWDLEDPFQSVPETLAATPTAEVWAIGGEKASRAFYVTGTLPHPQDVQFRLPFGDRLDIREVVYVLREDGSWVPDALPRMGQSRTLHLAPGETRQVWFVVSTDDLKPGTHEVRVEVLPLGDEADRFHLVFNIEVASVALDQTPRFPYCSWTRPSSIKTSTDEPGTVRELLDGGMTVFTLGAPGREFDAEGNLVGKANWDNLERELDALDPAKAIPLLHGPSYRGPKDLDPESDAYKKGLRNAVDELVAYMASKGYPIDGWAYYPVDEPGLFGGTLIQKFKEIVEPVHNVAPDVQFYANPTGGFTPENFEPIAHLIDVWQPELGMLKFFPHFVDYFLAIGDPVWCYEAPPEDKRLLPLGYYRAQPLMAMALGLRGAGRWVYGYLTETNDLWVTDNQTTYGDNYMDGARVTQSRRWLAAMDGVEDARLLLLLKDTVAELKANGDASPEIAEAERLLGTDLPRLLRKQWKQDDISRHIIDYEIDFATIEELRREAVRLIETLRLERNKE